LDAGREHGYLRPKQVLEWRWVYYVAAVLNFFFRVAWIITISPDAFGIVPSSRSQLATLRLLIGSFAVAVDIKFDTELVLLLIGSLEVARRNMWNFFRLENEHLYNCENYR